MKNYRQLAMVILAAGLLLVGGALALAQETSETYEWDLPAGFPAPRVPEDNPMSTEKVELGRYLFYDVRLSGNERISCSSCHLQALAFSDGLALSPGATGELTHRNSMSLANSAYSATLTWSNPNLVTIERQILVPMFGEFPVEMGITGNEEAVLERFRSEALYEPLFAAAFPDESDPVSFGNINKALASFVRTLISGNSIYDQYRWVDKNAMSESAKRGMAMFLGETLECHHCHTGFNFSLSTAHVNTTFEERAFFNTGLYNLNGTGAYPAPSQGVFEVTGQSNDMGKFRPPSLRNVELTAPYMHDGSIATLEDVIQFYADGGRNISEGPYAGDGRENPLKSGFVSGFELSEQEREDLLNFLLSLTDVSFTTDPRFSDPFAAG